MSDSLNNVSLSTRVTPSISFGVLFQAMTLQPKDCARLAVLQPMAPRPTTPTVLFAISLPGAIGLPEHCLVILSFSIM